MLRSKIQQDQITALKSHDQVKLITLRFILSQIKNKEIEKNPPAGGELTDEEVLIVLQKTAKELKESIEAFTKGTGKTWLTNTRNSLMLLLHIFRQNSQTKN